MHASCDTLLKIVGHRPLNSTAQDALFTASLEKLRRAKFVLGFHENTPWSAFVALLKAFEQWSCKRIQGSEGTAVSDAARGDFLKSLRFFRIQLSHLRLLYFFTNDDAHFVLALM